MDESLRITVLASGEVFLNGEQISLLELDDELKEARHNGIPVQYYPADAVSQDSPEAAAVIKLIAANRVRLTLPAEAADADSQPAPAATKVIEFPAFEALFSKVRQEAVRNRGVSIIRPGGEPYILPAPEPGSVAAQRARVVEAIVPANPPRNIAAVVHAGAFAGEASQAPRIDEIGRHVPFLGMLIGLAYVGHAVWAFETDAAMLVAGSREADILIVDSEALQALPRGWQDEAADSMRNANILVFDRSKEKLGALRTAGEIPGQLAFPA